MAQRGRSLKNKRGHHNSKPYDISNSFFKKVTNFLPQKTWLSKWFNSDTCENETSTSLQQPVHLNNNNNNPNIDYSESEDDNNLIEEEVPPSKRARHHSSSFTSTSNNFTISSIANADLTRFPIASASTITATIGDGTKTTSTPRLERSSLNERRDDEEVLDYSDDEPIAGPSGIQKESSTDKNILNIDSQRNLPANITLNNNESKLNGDNHSESSESTSGCSSLVPQTNRVLQQNLTSNIGRRSSTIDEKFNFSNQQAAKSLFNIKSLRNSNLSSRSPRHKQQPSFNISVFTNSSLNTSRNNSRESSITTSPFYSGQTTYGGASAYSSRKNGLFGNDSFSNTPKESIQVRPERESRTPGSAMSRTAQRILDALEHLSTPVLDAKRIPIKYPTTPSSQLLSRKRKFSSTVSQNSSHDTSLKMPPTHSLNVPTVPDLLKLQQRERLLGTTAQAREVASDKLASKQLTISPNSTSPKNIINIDSSKNELKNTHVSTFINSTKKNSLISSTLKTHVATKSPQDPNDNQQTSYRLRSEEDDSKSRKITKFKSKHKDYEDAPIEEVNLPEVELPITSLPKFDFMPNKPETKPTEISVSATQDNILKTTSLLQPNLPKDKPSVSPVPPKDITNTTSISLPIVNFKSSIKNTSAIPKSNNAITFAPPTIIVTNHLKIDANYSYKFSDPIDLTSEMKSLNGIVSSSPLLKTTTTTSTITTTPTNNLYPIQQNKNTWECSTCLVRNKPDTLSCIACTMKRNDDSKSTSISHPLPKDNFGDQFKKGKDQWECPTCMVRNQEQLERCQACSGPKPGADPPKTITPAPLSTFKSDSKLGDLSAFCKKPSDSWTCSICMINNKKESLKCIACEEPQPGLKTTSSNDSSLVTSTIKFTTPLPGGPCKFKFGIDKVDGGSEKPLPVPQFKPSTATGAKFTFGIPPSEIKPTEPSKNDSTLNINNEKGESLKKEVESSKKEHSPSRVPITTASTFTFGIPQNENKETSNQEIKSSSLFQVTTPISTPSSSNTVSETVKLNATPIITFPSKETNEVSTTTISTPSFTSDVTKPNFTFGIKPGSEKQSSNQNQFLITPSSTSTNHNSSTITTMTTTTSTTLTSVTTASATTTSTTTSSFGQNPFISIAKNPFGSQPSNANSFDNNSVKNPIVAPVSQQFQSSNLGVSAPFSSTFSSTSGFNNNPSSGTFGTKPEDKVQQAATFSFGNVPPAVTQENPTVNNTYNFGNSSNKPAQSEGLFTFGTPSTINTHPTASITSAAPAPLQTSGEIFGFKPTPFAFNNTNPPSFGSGGTNPTSTSNEMPPAFGAFGQTNVPSTGMQSTGFNFSASSNPQLATGMFSFSGNQNQQQPVAPFNFSATSQSNQQPTNAFNPSITPTFNFSGGNTPTFSATTPSALPGRKFKKAVRRR